MLPDNIGVAGDTMLAVFSSDMYREYSGFRTRFELLNTTGALLFGPTTPVY